MPDATSPAELRLAARLEGADQSEINFTVKLVQKLNARVEALERALDDVVAFAEERAERADVSDGKPNAWMALLVRLREVGWCS